MIINKYFQEKYLVGRSGLVLPHVMKNATNLEKDIVTIRGTFARVVAT